MKKGAEPLQGSPKSVPRQRLPAVARRLRLGVRRPPTSRQAEAVVPDYSWHFKRHRRPQSGAGLRLPDKAPRSKFGFNPTCWKI